VLEGFIADAEDVIEDLRRIAHGVSPPNLAADGLVDALRAECAASALAVQLTADAIERSAPEVETAVYLCCLEAVQNASKHAGRDASVQIELRRDGADLAFSIHDTGSGFDPAAVNGRRPRMASSHARVHAIGGRVDIESSPGSGTTVTGLAPWPPRGA
jgi:signal transduction histidine kinase